MSENFNDYFRRPGYLGTSTTQIDSVNDDWSDYFSHDINTNKTYNEVEEIQKSNAEAGTFMNACPVVIKKKKPIDADVPEEWTVNNVDESQQRMVAMQEQWNAMQASFNASMTSYEDQAKMTKEVLEDDSDMNIPGIKYSSLSDIAREEQQNIDRENSDSVKTLTEVIDETDSDNEVKIDDDKETKEIDASDMSNEELLANLGIELNDDNSQPVVEFNDVSVEETKNDDNSNDIVEVIDMADVNSNEPVEDAQIIEEKKPAKKTSSVKKTPAKTNKSATAKTNKKTATTKKTKK